MNGLTRGLLIVGVFTVRTALALNPERYITEFAGTPERGQRGLADTSEGVDKDGR